MIKEISCNIGKIVLETIGSMTEITIIDNHDGSKHSATVHTKDLHKAVDDRA